MYWKMSKLISVLTIVYTSLFCNIGLVAALEREMTISIEPGKRDCFFERAEAGQVIDIEYQVIDGGHGDLDINFELKDVNDHIIVADHKKSDNIHRHDVKQDADYSFCFDNSFSTFNRKTVFFEMIIEKEGEPDYDTKLNNELLDGLSPEEFYDMKVQDIQDVIGKVKSHITKARQYQDILRSYEARDRNVAEANNWRVSWWSMFQIALMLIVGNIQVIMVRSLFDLQSKGQKIWSKFF